MHDDLSLYQDISGDMIRHMFGYDDHTMKHHHNHQHCHHHLQYGHDDHCQHHLRLNTT